MTGFFFNTADAVEFRPEKMNKVNLYESPRLFCDVYCLQPGQAQKDHAHEGSDKIYYVLSGVCEVRVGDERRKLRTGEVAVAPEGVIHGVRNSSDQPATLLVMMAPHPKFIAEAPLNVG